MGGVYYAFIGDDGQVVDQTTVPTPTTVLTIGPNPTRLVGQGPLDPGANFADADEDPSTPAGATFLI
jgi:hypothetical protein